MYVFSSDVTQLTFVLCTFVSTHKMKTYDAAPKDDQVAKTRDRFPVLPISRGSGDPRGQSGFLSVNNTQTGRLYGKIG